uniref:Replication initiator protein n=2 Tax=unclassified Caudoviricetes TaxID=2788787 RepID=A0A8S5QD03_9CAUD|nr:MAG TPA: replication initiator protein [Siphoviridae sp. ctQWG7]DAE16731.1 MAG TPA: replication initiator protein [Siphoviridae sp. ct8Hy2]
MVYTLNDITNHEEFYRLPRELVKHDKFGELSSNAKILYALMRDRLTLSIKNNWTIGIVPYIHYSIDETKSDLNVARATAVKAKKELLEIGLIETRKVFNGSDVIFVNKITDILEKMKSSKTEPTEVQKLNYESSKTEPTEVQKLNSNHTYYNHTNYNHTEIEPSGSTTVGGNTLFSKAKKDKPASPTTATPLGEFNQLILENFGKQPSPLQVDEMRYLVEEHKMEVLRLAVKEAVDNGKPYFAYLNGILNRWKNDGLTTAELVRNRVKPRGKSGKVTMLDDGYDPKLGI